MKWRTTWILIGAVASSAGFISCGGDNGARCGPGTELIAGQCLPLSDAGVTDASQQEMDANTSTPSDSCGDHAFLIDGKCRGVQAVGGSCQRGGECDSQTCLPDDDGFPGGYCSVVDCNDLRPCPTGSQCFFSSARNHAICLAFCSGTSECRDGYVCQPLYGTDIGMCAPSCAQHDTCPDQTVCDQDSGKCILRDCDVNASNDSCGDGRICYPDPKKLTEHGGLCVSTCSPSDAHCKPGDVCQPLPEDPANKGICLPPVCTASADCPVGAICKDSVCQPPARCDDAAACSDDTTTCVGGKGGQCMPKCTDNDACDKIHSGLTCANSVASTPVCLPVGSFPGSACRADKNSQCDSLTAGATSAKMACENNTCVVECGTGGDALCKAIRSDLNCASGIYDQPVCLPSGAYPGAPCGGSNHDTCADVSLGQGVSAKQLCKNNQCVFDCGSTAIGSSDAEKYCSGIDPTLTCATKVFPNSAVCLPQGSYPGGPCAHGACSKLGNATMACEDDTCLVTCSPSNDTCSAIDASLVCAHGVYAQDVCLPKGAFPGGPCGGTNHDQCAQDLRGVSELDMQCVSGTCVIGCSETGKWSGYGEALCGFADPSLTCAAAAGNVCVKACTSGTCSTGYSCLDAGTAPTHENACLPNGSFPGSACAANNACGAGPGGTTMACHSGSCVVNCPQGGSAGDSLCQAVSSALTCSDAAGKICLPACDQNKYGPTKCPTGLSCLASENSCLPNGSFLGSACASGSVCSGTQPPLACVPGQNPVCGASCSLDNGQSAANTYCGNVATAVGTDFNTCTTLSGSLHICTHQ